MKKPFHKKMTSESPMYIYATEMVSQYYSFFDMKNKRVLSIIGSGDQIIDAYFFGAKEVVGFDINKYASYILELKVLAIHKLYYEEFIIFFGKDMVSGILDFNLYNKLKQELSLNARKFFDKIYIEFNKDGKKLFQSDYFRQRSMIKLSAKEINIYLKNKKNYLKCREIIKDKNFLSLQLDINDISISKKIIGKFDIINLSNVLNYLTGNTEQVDILKTLIKITKKISNKIKKGGLFFYYSYSLSTYGFVKSKIPPASRLEMISSIVKINKFKVSFKRFGGIHHNTLDRINIFNK